MIGAYPAPRRVTLDRRVRFHIWNLPDVLVVSVATVLGLLVRLAHVLRSDFPLNDGGLFYVMIQDLQRAHYALPAYTSYNGADIPFAYPPLPFYIGGLVADVGPWSEIDVFRLLPLTFSALTIPAFYLLSRAMLRSRLMALIAVFAFALLPRSFLWEIAGGGLTRSLGFLLAVLALHQGYLFYTRRRNRFAASSAALIGLTILSHPEMGWFVTYSFAILVLAYGRDSQAARGSILVATGALAISAPWWIAVMIRHGVSPLLSAAQAGRSSWFSWAWDCLVTFDFTEEPFLPLLAMLGLVGVLACVADRRFVLPAWLLVVFVLDPRKAATNAMVPLAMLIAIGLASVVLRRPASNPSGPHEENGWLPGAFRHLGRQQALSLFLLPVWVAVMFVVNPREAPTNAIVPLAALVVIGIAYIGVPMLSKWADGPGRVSAWLTAHLSAPWPQVALALLLCYAVASAIGISSSESSPLHALSGEAREAMQWVELNTPEDSKFLVVTGDGSPWTDATSEWFPALTRRESVATVQGYEWLGKAAYDRQQARYGALQLCAQRDASCLEIWARDSGLAFTYVYLPKGDLGHSGSGDDRCGRLRDELRLSPGYAAVYDGPGASVFVRRLGRSER